ncbi:hypothetical protein TWF281_009586 [Arthrobotrys megalospora]
MDKILKQKQPGLNNSDLEVQLENSNIVVETPNYGAANSPAAIAEDNDASTAKQSYLTTNGVEATHATLLASAPMSESLHAFETPGSESGIIHDFNSPVINPWESEVHSLGCELSDTRQPEDTDEAFAETVTNGFRLLGVAKLLTDPESSHHSLSNGYCYGEDNSAAHRDQEIYDIENATTFLRPEKGSRLDYIATSDEKERFLLEYLASFALDTDVSMREAVDISDLVIESEGLYEPLTYRQYKKILKSQISPFNAEEHNLTFGDNTSITQSEIIDRSFKNMRQYLGEVLEARSFRKEFNEMIMHSPRFICQYGIYHFTTGHLLHQACQSILLADPYEDSEPQPLDTSFFQAIQEKSRMAYHILGIDGLRGMTGFFSGRDKVVRSFDDYTKLYPITTVIERLHRIHQLYLQRVGVFHACTIFAYCKLASIRIRMPTLYKAGVQMLDGIDHMIQRSLHIYPDYRSRRRIMMGLSVVGVALGEIGNYRLAIDFFEKAADLSKSESDHFGLDAIVRFRLGRCYYKAQRYKDSLEVLFRSAHRFQTLGFDNQLALVVFQISKAISRRAPPLYMCVLPQILIAGKFNPLEGYRDNNCEACSSVAATPVDCPMVASHCLPESLIGGKFFTPLYSNNLIN